MLDRLAVLNAPRAQVIRDGTERDIAVEEVVLDDLIALRPGDQIVTDGVVRSSAGLQVDESLLTGESQPIAKGPEIQLLSGSFVVAGTGRIQATAVGVDAYARKLAAEARRFAPARSELTDGINRILRYVTWAIVPVAALLLLSQIRSHSDATGAVSSVVAGLVGMVPQGLVLLTSVAFAAAAVTLARREVLVQELPAVEGLRAWTWSASTRPAPSPTAPSRSTASSASTTTVPVEAALGGARGRRRRRQRHAGRRRRSVPGLRRLDRGAQPSPFSSARKWSAVTFGGHGTWVLGAPETRAAAARRPELARAASSRAERPAGAPARSHRRVACRESCLPG